jgi:hypothetical protein
MYMFIEICSLSIIKFCDADTYENEDTTTSVLFFRSTDCLLVMPFVTHLRNGIVFSVDSDPYAISSEEGE